MTYKECPAIKEGKAYYSPINPKVIICKIDSCPYEKKEEITWEGVEKISLCDGKIRKDLSDKTEVI